jgi:hypothetical protein
MNTNEMLESINTHVNPTGGTWVYVNTIMNSYSIDYEIFQYHIFQCFLPGWADANGNHLSSMTLIIHEIPCNSGYEIYLIASDNTMFDGKSRLLENALTEAHEKFNNHRKDLKAQKGQGR